VYTNWCIVTNQNVSRLTSPEITIHEKSVQRNYSLGKQFQAGIMAKWTSHPVTPTTVEDSDGQSTTWTDPLIKKISTEIEPSSAKAMAIKSSTSAKGWPWKLPPDRINSSSGKMMGLSLLALTAARMTQRRAKAEDDVRETTKPPNMERPCAIVWTGTNRQIRPTECTCISAAFCAISTA
jgi:hypothetical protein